MKLLLLQDVKNVGKKGTVVEVADGYARNFMLPRKLAVVATDGIVKSVGKEATDLQAKKQREKEQARELAESLGAQTLNLTVKVGDKGKLFGSITSQDIVDAVKAQFKHSIEKKAVQLKDPIKALGDYEVPVKLHPEVNAKLRLTLAAAP